LRIVFDFMPKLAEIAYEYADRIYYSFEPNNTAAGIGEEINSIAHSDGTMLSFEQKIEIVEAIAKKLRDPAFKENRGGSKFYLIYNDEAISGLIRIMLDYLRT
jgi:hypothetical protein